MDEIFYLYSIETEGDRKPGGVRGMTCNKVYHLESNKRRLQPCGRAACANHSATKALQSRTKILIKLQLLGMNKNTVHYNSQHERRQSGLMSSSSC